MIPKSQKGTKYQINSFIANSRLIKTLNKQSYSISSNQAVDIKCGKWSFLILTMQYHIKFPRYISNKLSEIKGKCEENKLVVIVIIQNQGQTERYSQVQMICLQRNVKNIPCFSVEEARGILEDIYYENAS